MSGFAMRPGGSSLVHGQQQQGATGGAPGKSTLTEQVSAQSQPAEEFARGPGCDPGTPPPALDAWPPQLAAAADQAALDDVWCQAVEAVAAAAAAGAVDAGQVTMIAHAGGQRVWDLARQRASDPDGDRGTGHCDAIYRMRAVVAGHQGGASAEAADTLRLLDTELDYAARGATTIDWDRSAPADRPERDDQPPHADRPARGDRPPDDLPPPGRGAVAGGRLHPATRSALI